MFKKDILRHSQSFNKIIFIFKYYFIKSSNLFFKTINSNVIIMSANKDDDKVVSTDKLKDICDIKKLDNNKNTVDKQNSSSNYSSDEKYYRPPLSESNRMDLEMLNDISERVNQLKHTLLASTRVTAHQVEEINERTADELTEYINSIDWSERVKNVLKGTTIDVKKIFKSSMQAKSGKVDNIVAENITECASKSVDTNILDEVEESEIDCKDPKFFNGFKANEEERNDEVENVDLPAERSILEYVDDIKQIINRLLKLIDKDLVISEDSSQNLILKNLRSPLVSKDDEEMMIPKCEDAEKNSKEQLVEKQESKEGAITQQCQKTEQSDKKKL